MVKVGLIFQMISFLLFFWDAEIRPLMDIDKGGGFCTHSFEKEMQLEKIISIIPWGSVRKFLSKYFHGISAGLFIIGTFFQVVG